MIKYYKKKTLTMNIKLELFGASKDLSNKDYLEFNLKKQSTIKDLRNHILKFIDNNFNGNKTYKNIVSTSAFCSEDNEIINSDYKINKNQTISIIPPIGGG